MFKVKKLRIYKEKLSFLHKRKVFCNKHLQKTFNQNICVANISYRLRYITGYKPDITSPKAIYHCLRQRTLSSPQKKSATVPGPECEPIVVPMSKISTLPLSLGKVSSTSSATIFASSMQSELLMKHLSA